MYLIAALDGGLDGLIKMILTTRAEADTGCRIKTLRRTPSGKPPDATRKSTLDCAYLPTGRYKWC